MQGVEPCVWSWRPHLVRLSYPELYPVGNTREPLRLSWNRRQRGVRRDGRLLRGGSPFEEAWVGDVYRFYVYAIRTPNRKWAFCQEKCRPAIRNPYNASSDRNRTGRRPRRKAPKLPSRSRPERPGSCPLDVGSSAKRWSVGRLSPEHHVPDGQGRLRVKRLNFFTAGRPPPRRRGPRRPGSCPGPSGRRCSGGGRPSGPWPRARRPWSR